MEATGLPPPFILQQKGLKTAIFEQASTPGGATRTQELTLPGFKHDVGSAILPLGLASPFFRDLPLTGSWSGMGISGNCICASF